MDDNIKEAFRSIAFKPPSGIGQLACWANYAKEAGLTVWDVFRKIGLDSKTIQSFRYRWEEKSFSNYQRKAWLEYEKLYSTEVRFIISKLL